MPPICLRAKSNIAASTSESPWRRRSRILATVKKRVKAGHSSDLGGGGVRLATDEDLPLGSVLVLRFTIPSVAREIMAKGRIVLSFYNAEDNRFFHGIAFTSIDPRDQEEIVKYVSGEVQRLAVDEEPEGSEAVPE